MSQVVQTYVRESGAFKDFVVNGGHGVGVVHTEGDWGGEDCLKYILKFYFFL